MASNQLKNKDFFLSVIAKEASEKDDNPHSGNCLSLALVYYFSNKNCSIHIENPITFTGEFLRYFKYVANQYGWINSFLHCTSPHFYIIKDNYRIEFSTGFTIIPYLYSRGKYHYSEIGTHDNSAINIETFEDEEVLATCETLEL